MKASLIAAFGAGTLLSGALWADFASESKKNWHQWRGPEANGVGPSADPPLEWSEERNVRWKVPVPGRGSATPIVWNDRVFLLSAIPSEREAERNADGDEDAEARNQEGGRGRRGRGRGRGGEPKTVHQYVLLCFDRDSGKELWRKVAVEEVPHEGHHDTNTFASGSPITDGKRIFASFGSRGIFAFDMEGNQLWTRDLGDMQTRNGFGEGASPALHGDRLVVPWDHEGESFICALDASSGEVKWKVARDEQTTWATPLIVEHGGKTQVIANGSNRVRSYDLATGDVIWECGGQASNPIPSPVVLGETVYCMTGYRGFAVYAIPLDAKGDITGTDKIAWNRKDAAPYVSSPVLYEGRLWFTKSREAIVSSLDAKTGEPVIERERLPGIRSLYASPVAAAGRIYFSGREGTTVVLENSSKLEVLATNEIGEGIDASPALVGKQLFLRGTQHLYCIEAK